MNLSKDFSIDVNESWVTKHNQDVMEVVESYKADKPIRVPLLMWEWFGQHGFYADEIDLDYRDYYTDPTLMVKVQLESARRKRELPICDSIIGELPENWDVSVDLWPVVAAGWLGCEL